MSPRPVRLRSPAACRGPSRDRSAAGRDPRASSAWGSTTCCGSGPGRARGRTAAEPKARNCILIWLAGGPSHIDTFDPKPDAPADVRGEFKPIDTAVPGVQISEVFPKLAKVMDRVTLIRSMTSPEADHDRAVAPPAHRLSAEPALVYPELRQRGRQVRARPTAGHAAPLRGDPRRARRSRRAATSRPAYDPFAVGGRPQPGGLPRPQPDPARPRDARPAAAGGGRWSRRSTSSPATSRRPR